MTSSPAILDYGKSPPKRWRRRIALTAVVCVILATGWWFYRPVKAWLEDQYAEWQFRRAFDRAHRELIDESGWWFASEEPDERDARADALLRELLSRTPTFVANYLRDRPNVPLFVCAGRTDGQSWLCFAGINSTSIEVYTFHRRQRRAASYHRPLSMPAYVREDIKVAAQTDAEGKVELLLTVKGGRNQLSWSLVPTPRTNRPPLFEITVEPRAGWVSYGRWWPSDGTFRRFEGSPATAEVPAGGSVRSVAWLGPDRIAGAGPQQVSQIELANGMILATHGFSDRPRDLRCFVFSYDGTKLLVGGTSEPVWLIDVLEARVRQHAKSSSGRIRAAFIDDETLVASDNVSFQRIEWATGNATPIGMKSSGPFGATRDLIAVSQTGSMMTQIREAKTLKMLMEVQELQGIHQMSLSPCNRWLAMKGQSGLRLFDIQNARMLLDHGGDSDFHTAMSRIKWTPDGKMGAAAGNRYVYVWSMIEPRWIARLPHGRSGYSPDVALSPDGQAMVASAAASSMIAYWPDLRAAIPDLAQLAQDETSAARR